LQVGLGTDVAGGYSASMLDCIRQTMVATNVIGMKPDEDGTKWKPLRCELVFQEAFHLATMGGAEVLGLQHLIGNFLPGKQEIGLDGGNANSLIDGPFDLFPELGQGMQTAFEKFIFMGDDRNIEQVYVAGKRVV
ncbi:unnamed protein product, partial [Hapterophycus canaliculatus]